MNFKKSISDYIIILMEFKQMKAIIFSCVLLALTGCVSHKPPMPKGAWIPVNQAGFIPHTVEKYSDNVATNVDVIEVIEKTDQIPTIPSVPFIQPQQGGN